MRSLYAGQGRATSARPYPTRVKLRNALLAPSDRPGAPFVDVHHLALLTAEGCEGDSHHAARPEGDQGQDEVERPVAGLALDEHSLGLNSAHLRHEIGELPRQGLLALLGNRPGLSVGA